MMEHPYIKYAVAIIMEKCGYQSISDITDKDIVNELEACLNTFCLEYGKIENGYAMFDYTDKEPNWQKKKLETISNVILSPHVVTSDAKGLYDKFLVVKEKVSMSGKNTGTLYASILPIAKKYLQLTDKGNISRKDTRLSNKDIAYIMITTLTPKKPCSSKWMEKKGFVNTCIIPDISIEATKDFVSIFNRLQIQKTNGLLNGKVANKGKNKEVERPLIYSGNYSNAAKSPYLQSLSVLGYIGILAKEGEYSSKAHKVLEELKINPVFLVDSGSELASIIHYSHFIIELAKEGSLNNIIDHLYHIKLYKFKGLKRTDSILFYRDKGIKIEEKNIEYEKFDYYVSKFLTLFNHCAFNEFLSCRVEYPSEIRTILTLYFHNMEQISKDVVASAEAFGAWINQCSFIAAKNDSFPNRKWDELAENEKQKIVEKKYKFLVELESSVFSSDNNRSMISNIITRVGRLSNTDVPQEAALFVKAVIEPSIDIRTAKNLVIAFSRIHSKGDDYKLASDKTEAQIGETIDCSNI